MEIAFQKLEISIIDNLEREFRQLIDLAVISAYLLGQRSVLSEKLYTNYQKAGAVNTY